MSRIRASKAQGKYLVSCDLEDPDAAYFEVYYVNNYQIKLHFTNKIQAIDVAHALDNEFEAGKKQQLKELRNYLGIKL